MMRNEIDILLRAQSKQCTVVEKATNIAWSEEELREALGEGRFQQPDDIRPSDRWLAVSNPFPACGRQTGGGALALDYHLVGQTTHFVIFSALGEAGPAGR